jgi:hypothetical protein
MLFTCIGRHNGNAGRSQILTLALAKGVCSKAPLKQNRW